MRNPTPATWVASERRQTQRARRTAAAVNARGIRAMFPGSGEEKCPRRGIEHAPD